ncbi:hypothetical protein AMECASPLE_022020, partial [Ameca splendens]
PLNGVKHKVRRTRKYFSPLLDPSCQPQPSCEIPILSPDPVRIPERTICEEINCLNAVLVSS